MLLKNPQKELYLIAGLALKRSSQLLSTLKSPFNTYSTEKK